MTITERLVSSPWKATLISVLSAELTSVLDRFEQLTKTDKGLMDSVRLDLKRSQEQLKSIIKTLEKKE